ncbi:interleukin-1 receptor accessory protein-like 1 [Ostrea edulis]|uniref:interleukin-1 receptor accessory protein-like 1 n=1 Tax=Ostrea edulis TaxID=37623 RepID=UPI0024AF88BF|nr:interleukin-1 receptor accessory protein-like 1 [Ostrea edulis]
MKNRVVSWCLVICHTLSMTVKADGQENVHFKSLQKFQQFDETPALASKLWYYTEFSEHDHQGINLQCQRNTAAKSQETNIMWSKNGSPITANERVQLLNNNEILFIDDPQVKDKGWYNCSLWYQGTITDSFAKEITVDEKIQMTAPKVVQVDPVSRVKYVNLGESFNISCTFYEGNPNKNNPLGFTLERYWYFNDTEVPSDTKKTAYIVGSTENQTESVLTLTVNNVTKEDLGSYQCLGSNYLGADHQNISVELAKAAEDKSEIMPLWVIVSIAAGAFVILLVTLIVGIVIRQRRQEELEWPAPDMEHYDVPVCELEYDVFISYSSEDEEWVKDELLKNLEADGYKVYIDFKDFVPGMAIAENVLDAVYKSRKTVIVMSKNFLKSMWGQYELQQAHNKAIVKRDDVLVLIKYGKCKVPGKLLGKTFLDWTDKDVKPHFWSRLADFLGKPENFRSSLESEEERKKDPATATIDLIRMTSDYDSDFLDSDDVFLSSEGVLGIQRQNFTEESLLSPGTRNRVSTETNSRVSCDDESMKLIP